MSQAVESLAAVHGLPGQQAQDEKIVSSLLSALGSMNVPTAATGIAGSLAAEIETDAWLQTVDGLVSSLVSDLRNPAINTQIASIVDKLLGFMMQAITEAPELFYGSDNRPTPASSHTSTNTRTSTSAKPGTSASTPTSKSLSPRSTATSSANSQSSEEIDESDSSSHESSSKTNAAQSIKPLFGYMSLGTAAGVAVVASFF
ncbi:hypothetical protein GGF44_001188 [Coemansia sp. RSA 1694]|nr:hypothetical protein GGF44_001188 [Coemansia sp. RSA 1694]